MKFFKNLRCKLPELKSNVCVMCRNVVAWTQKNQFVITIGLILIYRLALDLVYIYLVSPIFAYQGLTISISPIQYMTTWLCVLLIAPFVADINQSNIPSCRIVTLFMYLYFIPLFSYFGCNGSDAKILLVSMAYCLILLFYQKKIPVMQLEYNRFHFNQKIMSALLILVVVFIGFISWKYTGFRIKLDFLQNEYGIRAESKAYDMPLLFRYMMPWSRSFLILALFYWISKKNYIICGIIILTYVLLYSIGAHKSYALLLLFSIACYFLYKDWMMRWISVLLTGGAIVSFIERAIRGSSLVAELLFRRIMFVPANLTEDFYLFFSKNPLDLFRNGVMGKLAFDQISSLGVPYRVGEYKEGIAYSANNGMLSDVFANLPVAVGVIVMPLIVVCCLRFMDAVSKGVADHILISFIVLYAICFISGAWSVTLLNDGYLLVCICLYMYPRVVNNHSSSGLRQE